MKLSPPYPLPANFPPDAPLPPGGPWIRPPSRAVGPSEPAAVFPPESGQVRPRAPWLQGFPLGVGLPPALTPLAMVEEQAARSVRSKSA